MKQLIAVVAMAGLLIMSIQAYAGGCGMGGGSSKGCSMDMKQGPVSVTGKIAKEVKKKNDKEIVVYFLVDSAGTKISLPNKPPSDIKYEDFVNADVKVTGTGTTMKDGTVCSLKSIKAIEKVTAPAATPAAAPAPPAEKTEKKCH